MDRVMVYIAFAAISCAAVGAANAQDTTATMVGARIRVRTAAHAPWQYGRLLGIGSGSIVMGETAGPTAQRFDLTKLEAFDVYERARGARSQHAGIGALAGALGSMVVLYAYVHHCDATDRHSEGPGCGIALAGMPVALAEGAVAGGVLGAVWPVRHWRPGSRR